MIGLDEALHRLLHDRRTREAFLRDGPDALDVSVASREALTAIDTDQLTKTAERIAVDLINRRHRGSGGLQTLFPSTLEAWRAAEGDPSLRELAYRFLASDAYDAYREHPFAGEGICLEEVFYRFATAEGIGHEATRRAEYLGAALRALAANPDPAFTCPDGFTRRGDAWFAIDAGVLYATVRGRVVHGAITPFLADLIRESPARHTAIAAAHRVGPSVLAQAQRRLADLGLLPTRT